MEMKDVRIEEDAEYFRLVKAVAHPVRMQLLAVMGDKLLSPKEFAALRGVAISKVGHHFRELRDLGIIEVVFTRPVRGSTEHIYRRTRKIILSDRDWLALPDEARQIIASTTLRELVYLITEALQAGTITALPNPHLSWWRLRLDELGWKKVAAYLEYTFNAIEEEQELAAERMRESGDEGFDIAVALLGFKAPPGRLGERA